MQKNDLIGHKFGRLTVYAAAPSNKRGRAQWLCRCECGGTKIVLGNQLLTGGVRSCGCLAHETAVNSGKANFKHGGGKSPEYRSYSMMRHRCLNPASKSYPDYGGRGIRICDRWLDSYPNFRADMGDRPSGTTLDRIDNDGPYSPENCRWATKSEQAQNTRTTRHFTINGVSKPLRDWIAESRLERSTIYKRLKRGMTLDAAIQ